MSGDLTSAFDFRHPNDKRFPKLPDTGGYDAIEAASKLRPVAAPPAAPAPLFQEPGVRYSRALPYESAVDARVRAGVVRLTFANTGVQGTVFHVYDKLHLDRIPRRYTVEAGRSLSDEWDTEADGGVYDLWVCSTNGFVRTFSGTAAGVAPEVRVRHHRRSRTLTVTVTNPTRARLTARLVANAYRRSGQQAQAFTVRPGRTIEHDWDVTRAGNWYDLTLTVGPVTRGFAGRLETGRDGVSDPAFGTG